MDVTVEKIKAWFGIGEDAIAQKIAEEKSAEVAAASAKIQSLKDQLTNAEAELAALTPEVVETPAEEAAETPAEEVAEGEVQG